ncbi:MAG: hypothetical protein KBC44_01410 [Candidatus Pacebacteria bacterium]|nr:hypothetical protein [Candidatus Paceibacterota bacterium]
MALKKSSKKKVVKKIKKLTKKKITKKVMKPKVVRRSVKKVNKPKKILKVKKTKKSKKIAKTIKRLAKKVLIKKKTLKSKSKKKVLKKVKQKEVKLERAWHNPIISPRAYPWESKATFNPAAFLHDDKVYIMYRAIGEDDMSVLGYAVSNDGKRINERPTHFAYRRYMAVSDFAVPIFYDSGGGWAGGCEDPRLTLIGDTLYLLYTAFDGWGSVRIAMANIKLDDFKNKKWNKWSKPVLISPPGEIHKNWVLFPEKIKGKYAILHSITPDVLVDYVDDLDSFDGNKFIKSNHGGGAFGEDSWDNWVRGVGPTPIKTSLGWLVLYHAMDKNDPNRYKLGALILDSKNPEKILYKSKAPILEPDLHYENEGHKWGVIYSCGAVVKDGELFVYYGGADKVTCVATIELKELLNDLKKNKVVKLKKGKEVKL